VNAGRSDIAIELPEGSGWDWNVLARDGGRFRLAEGAGITRHHDLKPTFTNPAFVRLLRQVERSGALRARSTRVRRRPAPSRSPHE
jgi:hypothetical protein